MAASRRADAHEQLVLQPADTGPVPGALSFSVPAEWVKRSQGLRFDAGHFNPNLARAITLLRGSGMDLRSLEEITELVFIPPRFRRVYVAKEYGIPFLQGSHLVHAEPADLKYLSRKAHKRIERWIIHDGWVLVTCSGTIGRVALARKQWDGWAASQHILRIVPKQGEVAPPGYLLAFLRSFAGQAQLTSQVYGAVVDELTEDQARAVLVPIARTARQRRMVKQINATVLESVQRQEEAVALTGVALGEMNDLLES